MLSETKNPVAVETCAPDRSEVWAIPLHSFDASANDRLDRFSRPLDHSVNFRPNSRPRNSSLRENFPVQALDWNPERRNQVRTHELHVPESLDNEICCHMQRFG